MKNAAIVLMAMVMMFTASMSFATDLPVDNPALALEGNTVIMKADLAGTVIPQQIRILFRNGSLYETAEIMPWADYYLSTGKNKTTIQAVCDEGWKLHQVISLNASQFYILFQK